MKVRILTSREDEGVVGGGGVWESRRVGVTEREEEEEVEVEGSLGVRGRKRSSAGGGTWREVVPRLALRTRSLAYCGMGRSMCGDGGGEDSSVY